MQISADPQTLDEVISYTPNSAAVDAMVYDRLWQLDAKFKPQPDLVQSEKVDANHEDYLLTLRSGITWQDGTPLTSADVVASVERYFKLSPWGQAAAPTLVGVTAPSANQVEIKFNKPHYGLESEFAVDGTEIYQKSVIDQAGEKPITKDHVVGTGPYKLQSWGADQIVLTKFDGYKSAPGTPSGYAGEKKAYFKTITYKFIADPNAILNALQTDEVDTGGITSDQYDQVANKSNLTIQPQAGNSIFALASNCAKGSVLSSPEAREALNEVFDKKAFLATQGLTHKPTLAVADGSFSSPGTAMYSTDGQSAYNDYNPQKAKATFKRLGITKIRVITSQTIPPLYQEAVVLQDDLKKIGVQAQLQVLDYGTMLVQLQNSPNTWDLATGLFAGISVTAPTAVPLVRPWGNFQTAGLVSLLNQYSAAQNSSDAQQVVNKIANYEWQNLDTIVVGQGKSFAAVSTRLHGYIYGENYANAWASND